jgi:hypothetical protein
MVDEVANLSRRVQLLSLRVECLELELAEARRIPAHSAPPRSPSSSTRSTRRSTATVHFVPQEIQEQEQEEFDGLICGTKVKILPTKSWQSVDQKKHNNKRGELVRLTDGFGWVKLAGGVTVKKARRYLKRFCNPTTRE